MILIRKVENSGEGITIRRRGQFVARLEPVGASAEAGQPWEAVARPGGQARLREQESVCTE